MKISLVFHIPPLKFYQACLGLFRGNITASLTLGPKAAWCKFIIFLLWLQDGFCELPFSMHRPELSEDVHRACSDTSGFRVSGVFLLQQGELLTCSAFSCRIRTLLPTLCLLSRWDQALLIQAVPKSMEQRINSIWSMPHPQAWHLLSSVYSPGFIPNSSIYHYSCLNYGGCYSFLSKAFPIGQLKQGKQRIKRKAEKFHH